MLDMTDQQLNRALAEFMGYSVTIYTNNFGWLIAPNGDTAQESLVTIDEAWDHAPNYCNDPAASLEVQAAACEVHPNTYIRNLEKIKWGQSTGWKVSNRVVAQLCNASPRERAEAAYMTLSSHPLREDI
ncbi:hypothetical protein [Paenibacillus sp. S29]|uniref:hypothetical protein n=1 Tax=Paenibacillus sp. S29 TaxID=3394611 RepID=UPI0039BFCF0C